MARPGLHKHPKFRRLMNILQEPESHCRGYLECLWDSGYECGNPVVGDEIDVWLACNYQGEASKIVEALLACGGADSAGFIERRNDGKYQIHDLLKNAPDYVRKRAQREQQRNN